jgi:hypothetical protein
MRELDREILFFQVSHSIAGNKSSVPMTASILISSLSTQHRLR